MNLKKSSVTLLPMGKKYLDKLSKITGLKKYELVKLMSKFFLNNPDRIKELYIGGEVNE